ncbi:hypothetical protein [Shewanella baltica]|uniref:Uncharacterized protein n=2 Tax=Shewanella baltica TaxID=62322 RepID=A9L6L3_SHEB9|nr:hypothetical protein [Shewanella baltica]ABS10502.1 conserved hypothetical protein [Shewanella baltica OS185]ABX51795.1 hypothetical protein Sbal195_4639 [Shewanella baltica OS195]
MSQGPAWLATAENNTQGNEVGTAAVIDNKTPRGKPGPKKSLVKRKVIGLNFSDNQNKKLDELEMRLKLAGIDLPRGRSEAAELAINTLLFILTQSPSDSDRWIKRLLENLVGEEEKQHETSQSN